jgi:hypothetical protein
MRRGAAWPARWPSSRLVVREHKHGWGLSVWSLGVAAKEVRMPAVLSSPCPRSCPASGVQCPVQASVSTGACPRDRCPVRRLSVQESSVRPPASVRCGVRGVRRHEVAGCGGGAGRRTAGLAGVGVVARHVHDGASSAEVGAWRSKLATGRAGPAEGRLGRGRRRGRWLAVGQADRVADRERLDAREDRLSGGSWR